MKAVLYVRVSSRDQEDGYSLDVQEREGRKYAQQKGLDIVKTWRVSESAWKEERLAFNEMVEYVRKGRGDISIIFDSVDRMTRNLWDIRQIMQLVEQKNSTIHFSRTSKTITRNSAPDDSFMMGIEALTAKRYSDEISFKVKRAMKEKASQGIYPTSAPLGYCNNKITRGIDPDPKTAPIIKRLFEIAATGTHSLEHLTIIAHREGLRTRRGTRIGRAHFHKLLKNPLYAGSFYWDGRLIQGVHEPLVSSSLFERVQEALGLRFKPKMTKRNFTFQGLMKCASCGHAIVGELRKQKYIYYHCTRCRGTYVREEAIDAQLAEGFKRFHMDARQAEMIREMISVRHETQHQRDHHKLDSLTTQRRRLDNWIEQAYVDKLEGDISEADWRERTNRWKQDQIGLDAQIALLQPPDRMSFQRAERVLELLQRLPSLYVTQDHTQKRLLLKNLLSNCTLADGTPCPEYRKPFDILAEGLPRQEWRGRWDSNPRPPA